MSKRFNKLVDKLLSEGDNISRRQRINALKNLSSTLGHENMSSSELYNKAPEVWKNYVRLQIGKKLYKIGDYIDEGAYAPSCPFEGKKPGQTVYISDIAPVEGSDTKFSVSIAIFDFDENDEMEIAEGYTYVIKNVQGGSVDASGVLRGKLFADVRVVLTHQQTLIIWFDPTDKQIPIAEIANDKKSDIPQDAVELATGIKAKYDPDTPMIYVWVTDPGQVAEINSHNFNHGTTRGKSQVMDNILDLLNTHFNVEL